MTPIKLQLGAHNIGLNYAPAPEPASERPVPVSSTVRYIGSGAARHDEQHAANAGRLGRAIT
jgi:hypothetical protein